MILPTWGQMSDVDKGAALLHLRKIEVEGREYAREEYPPKYLDHPVLTALDDEAANDHAENLFEDFDDAERTLGIDEVDRLRAVARDAQPTPRQHPEEG